MAKHNEVKKITTGLIFGWIFGILFLLMGVGVIAQSQYILGILIILCSILIIPYFDKIIAEKFHFEISGGVKVILAIVILILLGMAVSRSLNVAVQPTERVAAQQATQPSTQSPTANTAVQQTTQIASPKVKSATLTLDRVTQTASNLDKIRLTISNTGDVSITPRFDVIVTDTNGNVVCEGSPMWGIGSISSKETKTDEIQILVCIMNKDGDYNVKVDLLDEDFKKLDTASKILTVDYWGKFNFN